ncbi:MAG: acetoin utilization protein AcuC [Pseudomonadota bacterium]
MDASQQPLFIGSQIYRGSRYGAAHPLSIPRVPTVIDLSRALGWLPETQYRTSPRAKPAALNAFHTTRYLDALQQAETDQNVSDATRDRHGLGTLSNPIFTEMFRRPATAAGGTLLAVALLEHGGVVYNPGGGTHHGQADRAAGFCYLNDPVLGLQAMRRQGLDRVAYVDVDAHHCDGVEAALAGQTWLRSFSIHEADRWPFTGAETDRAGGIAWNMPVPRAFNDSEFDLLLNDVILPEIARFRPQAIMLQCGADAVTEDPLSRLSLSNGCHRRAVAALREMTPRLLVLGGGGYNPWSVARAWTGVWATLSGHEIPDRLPQEGVEVLEALTWHRKAGRPPPALWQTTLADAPRPGPVRASVRRMAERLKSRSRAAA